MANFLGPNYGHSNADNIVSLFNEAIANSYNYDTYYDGVTHIEFRRASTNIVSVSVMFVLSTPQSISSIDVWMRRIGSPNGTITGNLYIENTLGIPNTGVSLGASAAVNASVLSSNYERVKFTFATPVALNASQNYYLVLTSTVALSNTDYMQIAGDATPVGYIRAAQNNGSWAVLTSRAILDVFYKVTTQIGQGFVAAGNQQIDEIKIWLKKTGSPGGSLYLQIYGDLLDNPDPNNSIGAASDILSAAGLTTTAVETTFTFSVPVQLTDGLRYHFVLIPTGTYTSANYVSADSDITSPTFSAGKLSINNLDGTWQSIAGTDLTFGIYYLELSPPDFLSDSLALLGAPPLDCHAQQVWLQALVNTLSTFFPSILPTIYGGTGVSNYSPGDMLYASSPYHLERLAIGNEGQGLGVTPDGFPAWGANSGALIINRTNGSSSVTLYEGDVVVYAPNGLTHDRILYSTIRGDKMFAGVVQATILPGESGPIMIEGVTRVKTTGAVTRGEFLDVSSTAGAAYQTFTGPMKCLETQGGGGSNAWAYINAAATVAPYCLFTEVQAFNVQGTTLTSATWTQIGLNTEVRNTHNLFALTANQLTVRTGAGGVYRVKASVPLAAVGTTTLALAKLRRVTGSVGDLLTSKSPGISASAGLTLHTELIGEITLVDADVIEFQGYMTGSAALRAGTAHGLTGFNNTYLSAEFEKMT